MVWIFIFCFLSYPLYGDARSKEYFDYGKKIVYVKSGVKNGDRVRNGMLIYSPTRNMAFGNEILVIRNDTIYFPAVQRMSGYKQIFNTRNETIIDYGKNASKFTFPAFIKKGQTWTESDGTFVEVVEDDLSLHLNNNMRLKNCIKINYRIMEYGEKRSEIWRIIQQYLAPQLGIVKSIIFEQGFESDPLSQEELIGIRYFDEEPTSSNIQSVILQIQKEELDNFLNYQTKKKNQHYRVEMPAELAKELGWKVERTKYGTKKPRQLGSKGIK